MLRSLLCSRKSDPQHGGCAGGEDTGSRRTDRRQVLSSRLQSVEGGSWVWQGSGGGLKVFQCYAVCDFFYKFFPTSELKDSLYFFFFLKV